MRIKNSMQHFINADCAQKNPIRVAFVGNIANNFFREVHALQRCTDIDAVLYMASEPGTSNTELPESDDPKLAGNYPDWIRILPKLPLLSPALYFRWWPKPSSICKLFAELDSYDICILSGLEVIFIPHLSTKTIYRATGSDLTVFPIFSFKEYCQLRPNISPSLFRNPLKFIHQFISYNLMRAAYRKAIRSANYINSSPADPYRIALDELGVSKKRRIDMFLLAINTRLFLKDANKAAKAASRWGIEGFNFVVFMPSRLMIRDTNLHVRTGQWKASDQAIYQYKALLESLSDEERSKVILLIPDRTHSDDLQLAKKLICNQKIEENVMFLKGDSQAGLTRDELIQLYSLSDVVLDDFGSGWYGSVVVEALACSCPTITYASEAVMERFPWHPIQIAKTSEQIYQSLKFLYSHAEKRKDIANRSRLWIEEFHSEKSVSKKIACSLKVLMSDSDCSDNINGQTRLG